MTLMVALALVLLALTPGCADEEVCIDCPFSNSIEESCTSLDETVAFTCVVESHPFCLEAEAEGTDPPRSNVCYPVRPESAR